MGILEQILAELQQLRAAVAVGMAGQQQPVHTYTQQYAGGQLVGQTQPVQQAAQQYVQQQQPVQQPVQQYAQQQPVQQAATYAPATEEQIMALIQPHIGNEQIKNALGTVMRGMGIPSLPEAQPHQYPEMYARFVATLAQFSIGAAPAQQAAAAVSII